MSRTSKTPVLSPSHGFQPPCSPLNRTGLSPRIEFVFPRAAVSCAVMPGMREGMGFGVLATANCLSNKKAPAYLLALVTFSCRPRPVAPNCASSTDSSCFDTRMTTDGQCAMGRVCGCGYGYRRDGTWDTQAFSAMAGGSIHDDSTPQWSRTLIVVLDAGAVQLRAAGRECGWQAKTTCQTKAGKAAVV